MRIKKTITGLIISLQNVYALTLHSQLLFNILFCPMPLQKEYDEVIKPEIEALVAEVTAALVDKPSLNVYYKGWRVFFSPVLARPKVLFVGINPGNGQSGNIDLTFWGRKEIFEYTNPAYNFVLARETRAAFEQAGLTDVLATAAVKTNYFFLSTTRAADLFALAYGLGRAAAGQEELLGDKLFRKSAEWTRRLIELLAPQTIVCEGKAAYEYVQALFPAEGRVHTWENNCGYTLFPDQTTVLVGYSRLMSHIRDKNELAQLLKRFVVV